MSFKLDAFIPGLVSVTFRDLAPQEIVDLCVSAGLECIEWGGDVHVPPGNVSRAREISKMTADAGLAITAYGSYHRLGEGNPDHEFGRVLETAVALQAPRIRVWAGSRNAADVSPAERCMLVEQLNAFAESAAKAGVKVCLEYHLNTLTDSLESVDLLMSETSENVRFLWQPSAHHGVKERLRGLQTVLPRLEHLHVYQWDANYQRYPLEDGQREWEAYLEILAGHGRTFPLLLEFVQGDITDQLLADAKTLNQWIQKN